MKAYRLLAASCLLIGSIASGGVARADEVCRPCPFNCEYAGIPSRDCSDRGRRGNLCCVDLDRRGQDALRDREQGGGWGNGDWRWGNRPRDYDRPNWDNRNWGGGHNDWSYNNRRNDPGAYDDRYGYQPGDCPPGFHVNERPCTWEERNRGCRDLRSRSGLTCVGWGR